MTKYWKLFAKLYEDEKMVPAKDSAVLKVLEHYDDRDHPVDTTEVMRTLSLSRPTVLRILNRLVDNNYARVVATVGNSPLYRINLSSETISTENSNE